MTMVVCIDCPTLIPKGTGSRRCDPCRRSWNKRRNDRPTAVLRRKHKTPGLVGYCVCCGTHGPMTKDHIIPLIKGGSPDMHNVQLMCRPCNASKGAGTECLLHASEGP